MAEEPADLVLPVLQQLQSGLTEIKATLADHGRRLEHIERDMKDLRGQFIYALGAATAADLRSREVEGRADELDEKMKALEAALAEKS